MFTNYFWNPNSLFQLKSLMLGIYYPLMSMKTGLYHSKHYAHQSGYLHTWEKLLLWVVWQIKQRHTDTNKPTHKEEEVESVSASGAEGNIRANIFEICSDCSTCLTTLWKGSLQRDKTFFFSNPSIDPVCLLLCPAQVKLLLWNLVVAGNSTLPTLTQIF